MAVWQMDFYLIKIENIKFYDETKPWASDDDNENLLIWNTRDIKRAAIDNISKLLPPEENWSFTTEQFGCIESTCLQISHFEGDYCQISFRLDLRNLGEKTLFEILTFINLHNAGVVYNNKCYQVNDVILNDLIASSNAKKYCDNPEKFLQDLKKEIPC